MFVIGVVGLRYGGIIAARFVLIRLTLKSCNVLQYIQIELLFVRGGYHACPNQAIDSVPSAFGNDLTDIIVSFIHGV